MLFRSEYSYLGTPYVQENCDIAESDNLVIYGHHIKGGKMFGALAGAKSPMEEIPSQGS